MAEEAAALNTYLEAPTFSYYVGPRTRLVSYGVSKYVGVARKSTNSWQKSVHEADRFPFAFFDYGGELVPGASYLRFRIDRAAFDRKLEFEKKFWQAVPPSLDSAL